MARDTVRVRRGEGGVDQSGEPRLGYDEALVGGADEQAAQIVIDPSERENNPYLGSEHDDESWDLPDDQREKPAERPPVPERQAREEPEGGDDEEDVRLAYDEPDEEQRSSRRRRRNQSRKVAIDRRDQTIDELARTNEQLKAMVTNLYGGQFQLSARDVEQRIQFHQNAIDRADMEIAKAIKEADGDTAVALQRERDKINYDLWQLQGVRRNIEEQAQQLARGGAVDRQPQIPPEQQAAMQAADQEYERMRDVFLDRYTWFDPDQGDDPDHDYVKKIDRTLVSEGYHRHTKAFWHEMERRMQSGGFRPDGGRDDHFSGDDEDDDRGFESRRNFQSRRNGAGNGAGNGARRPNLPPTGAVRSISRPGRANTGFQLSDIQIDMLRDEDLLRSGLTEAEEAKKTRIIDKWRRGAQQLTRGRN